jgi:uncharacterized alpha-E superfamily protein
VDSFLPGTLAHAVRHTVESAHAVRELLSGDTWLVLGSLDRVLVELGRGADPDLRLQATLSRVLEGLLALSGLAVESMVRDSGWYLMDAGRRIERAIQLVSLLRHSLAERRPPAVDDLMMESVLIAAESVITYRRRNPGRPKVADVLALLLLDPGNPRGVQHQVDRLGDDLNRLPSSAEVGPRGGADLNRLLSSAEVDPGGGADPRSRLRALRALLGEADIRELAWVEPAAAWPENPARPRVTENSARPRLAVFLDRLSLELAELAEAMARTYFARAVPPQPMPATPAVELR